MLVSILMPVFNVESYINEALLSISQQTHRNIEIIVVDDGSTDRTLDLCYQIAKMDKRIKVYRQGSNLGIVAALNLAFSKAKGEYIGRMDGDDISEPDRIERQMDYLKSVQSVDLVGVNLIGIDINGRRINTFEHLWHHKLLIRSLRFVTPVSHVWLARRRVYEKLGGYRELPGCEDYDFLLRMHTAGMAFGNIPNYYGYKVRINREGNTIETKGLSQRRMFKYAYRLYEARRRGQVDSYSNEEMRRQLKCSRIATSLYRVSTRSLLMAIKAWSNGNKLIAVKDCIIACVSPEMVVYFFERGIYRMMLYQQKLLRFLSDIEMKN